MDKQYFYKIKDIEDDKYSIYLCTSTKCDYILQQAIEKCKQDNNIEESLMYYINENLTKHNIDYLIIKWNVLEF